MTLANLTFEHVDLVNRDLSGEKRKQRTGYTYNYTTFAIEIVDSELRERLLKDGITLWNRQSEPDRFFMDVRVSNKFGNVQIAEVFPDGLADIIPDKNWYVIDKLFLRGADVSVAIRRYQNPNGGETTAAYLKNMIVYLMDENEIQEVQEQDNDPIAQRIKNLRRG